MNNNILKEIEPNIIKNGDASYTTLDMCIKQNNVFGILFLSEIVPNLNKIIQIFSDLFKSFKGEDKNIFTLIICICSEEKEDYEKTFLKISGLSCFVIPFDSKQRENVINKFNIIILPCMLIFTKDGKNFRCLTNEGIEQINSDIIKGWKNVAYFIQNKSTKKIEKYFIGMEGYIYGHSHVLFYADYIRKNPKNGKYNWFCEICGESHPYSDCNFYCDLCGFNVCDICYEKNKKF